MRKPSGKSIARYAVTVFSALLLSFIGPAMISAEVRGEKSILILYSLDSTLPGNVRFLEGFNETRARSNVDLVNIFQEFMDVTRINEKEYLRSLSTFYRSKYASKSLDLIITVNLPALDFMLKEGESSFPGVPFLSSIVTEEQLAERNLIGKIPAVTTLYDVRGCIDLILHLQPGLRNLYFVTGSNPIDSLRGILEKVQKEYEGLVKINYLSDLSLRELEVAVSRLPQDSAILYTPILKDRNGGLIAPRVVSAELSRAANCPVYAYVDIIGHGIVGGPLSSFYRSGKATGEFASGLLSANHTAERAPLMNVAPLKVVDEQQMLRWGLLERNLPDGYEITNRVPSLWRDYRYHVISVLLFLFAQSVLIFRLLVLGRIRRKAEQELRKTCRTLEQRQKELNRSRELQKTAIENLLESGATLQSILASIPVGVLMIDAETRTVQIANRAAAELLGTPLVEMPGSPCPGCFSSFIAEDEPGASRDGVNSFEDRIVNGSGREVYALKTVDFVSLGGRTNLIGCLLDITERKAAEREAREKEEQLIHADKMISLGTMAAGIAHEIHNPNNFILLNAPVLKLAWEGVLKRLDEYAEENGDFLMGEVPYSRARTHIPGLLDDIIEGAERIRNIVRDMKEFVSQKNTGDREPVDINAVLRSSLNLLASRLKKATDNLRVEPGENIPTVEANAQRLEQVAINLILNGAESLKDKGGSLSVRTYYEPERAMVGLEVIDNGSGIEPEYLKRVFNPFFTTKREIGGTGLGLAISQQIIESYGGRIVIDSTPGEGTTAVLELPACREGQ